MISFSEVHAMTSTTLFHSSTRKTGNPKLWSREKWLSTAPSLYTQVIYRIGACREWDLSSDIGILHYARDVWEENESSASAAILRINHATTPSRLAPTGRSRPEALSRAPSPKFGHSAHPTNTFRSRYQLSHSPLLLSRHALCSLLEDYCIH